MNPVQGVATTPAAAGAISTPQASAARRARVAPRVPAAPPREAAALRPAAAAIVTNARPSPARSQSVPTETSSLRDVGAPPAAARTSRVRPWTARPTAWPCASPAPAATPASRSIHAAIRLLAGRPLRAATGPAGAGNRVLAVRPARRIPVRRGAASRSCVPRSNVRSVTPPGPPTTVAVATSASPIRCSACPTRNVSSRRAAVATAAARRSRV